MPKLHKSLFQHMSQHYFNNCYCGVSACVPALFQHLIAISASQIGFASLHLSADRHFFSFLLRSVIHCFDPGYEFPDELALFLPQQYRPSLRLAGLGLKI
jgi:hypothetical protein